MSLEEKLEQLGVSDDIRGQLKTLAGACKEKLGLNESVVLKDFDKALEKTNSMSELTEEERIMRAFVKVKGDYKQQLRSPAKFFEGVVLGKSEPFDMTQPAKRAALAAYQEDSENAIKSGLVDAEGTPLDTKETFGSRPNPGFGKPLPKTRYIANLFGMARMQGETDFKVVRMPLGENLALMSVPLMTAVTFRANLPDKQPDDGSVRLNPYAQIEFKELDMDLKVDDIFTSEILKGFAMNLTDIAAVHDRLSNDPQRVVIACGDVQYLSAPNDEGRSRMLVLEDSSLSIDDDGITVWVPKYVDEMCVDFGSGSRVYVIGSTSQQSRDDGIRYSLNAMGIYAIPKYKMAADENPMGVVKRDVQQVS